MEGLRYTRAEAEKLFTSGFLNKFPPGTEQERNLVLDLEMFDGFVQKFVDKLRLNQPIEGPSGQVPLGPGSSFENRRVLLTWTGISRRQGEDCLLVHYEALRNHFQITSGPVTVTARSDYWGDMWIAARTRQIEYATLREEVSGIVRVGQASPQPLQLLRTGELERKAAP